MEGKPKFAKSEYQQENEQESDERSQLKSSQIVYAVVVRTTLETLPALKTALEKCFSKHDVEVLYQRASVGYLQIVEKPCWTKEEREAHLGLKKGEEGRP